LIGSDFQPQLLTISPGASARQYLGQIRNGAWVFADQVKRLARLVEEHGAVAADQACARALYFGALDGAVRVERILDRGLHLLPLDAPRSDAGASASDFGRPLAEYDRALFGSKEAC